MSEFDKVTHTRNSKGDIVKENHYILKITNGEQRFERPPKSGIWYSADGKLINEEKAINTMADSLLPKATEISSPVQAASNNAKSK